MSEKMELKPCPFCGGEAKSFAPYPELRRYWWTVECASCAASVSGEIDSKQDDATAAWNRRDPARLAGEREELTKAAQDVLAERERQIAAEGYTPAHDDGHTLGEIGLAAALYALPYEAEIDGEKLINQSDFIGLQMALEIACDWSLKPEPDRRKRLVKAGAMILAEIERIYRLPTHPGDKP